MLNPVELSQALIRCASVTPADAGAIAVLEAELTSLGFTCHRLPFAEENAPQVENLYARFGTKGPNLCFAGHTDVVPVGNPDDWSHPPFAAELVDIQQFDANNTSHAQVLVGRGAVDMKPAIAAWVAACQLVLAKHKNQLPGSLSLLITGDEEADAINGTRKVLGWMKSRSEKIDACIVGEPTNPTALGQMAKIGRRGSITFTLVVKGIQGHAAYPDQADNPVTKLVHILHALKAHRLDKGTAYFPPSNLEITTVDVGNKASNVIPAEARAVFNIRFNNKHSRDSLVQWVKLQCEKTTTQFLLTHHYTGDAFINEPGHLSNTVSEAVRDVLGVVPELSTTGGTSDARFIKDVCPVVEFGLINATAHQVDERVAVDDIIALTNIYTRIIERFFSL